MLALKEIILGILAIDDTHRRLCEQRLEEMKKEPDTLVLALLKLLQASPDADHRKLSATLLKRFIAAMSNPGDCVWKQLTKDTQKVIKEQLLVAVAAEPEPRVARLTCLVVAELAGTVQNADEEWPELDAFIHKLVTEGSVQQKEMGYLMMNYVFAYVQEKYETHGEELANLFAGTLAKDPLTVKVACIDALSHLLTNISSKFIVPFAKLLPFIANTVEETLKTNDEDNLKYLLEALTSVADNEPKYFSKGFDRIFQVSLQVAAKACGSESEAFDDDKIAQLAVEMVITILERIPSLLKKRPAAEYLVPLLRVLLAIMRMIPSEVDADWLKPQTTFFFEGEEEEDNINFGKRAVDRVLSCAKEIEDGLGLTLIGPILMEYFSNETDWRYKHAGLLAACNVGEYVDEPDKLSGLIPIVVQYVTHAHPRIRFAAIHCIGQIADDSEDDFPKMYHEKIMPALLAGLDDPVARVQRHACAAMCNFVDKMEKDIINLYVATLMLKLEHIIKTAEPIVQEYVMSVIASIAEATPDTFKANYYDSTMPFLINVLQNCKEFKYKKLRGHTIECITVVARAVGKEKFKLHMGDVIKALYNIQEHELESQDPQKCFLLSAWQRLCLMLKSELVPYTEMLVPSLLKLAASVPGISISTAKNGTTVDLEKAAKELTETSMPDKEGKRKMVHVTTTDIEEKEAAINMLGVMIDELGGYLDKYVESFSQIVLHVLTRSGVESLREAAALTLKGLVKAVKQGKNVKATSEYIVVLVRSYLEALLKSALDEYEPEPLCIEIVAMKDVIEEGGKCLDQPALLKLFETAMKMMEDSDRRKIVNKELKEDEEADETEVELMKEENQRENELQLEIAQLIGILFKSHADEAACLVNMLYPAFLTEMLKPDASHHNKQLGLFLIIDMVEYLGYARIPALYPQFVELILTYSQSEEAGIRQACLYGIGAIAKNAGDFYPTVAEKCYKALTQAIEAKRPATADKRKWKAAKDNAISSLGKTIKLQGKVFPELPKVVKYWLDEMPLEKDVEEGVVQNELLADLILNNPALVLGANAENLETVIDIFIDVLETEQVNEEVSLKISKALNMLAGIPEIKGKLAELGTKWDVEDRAKLETCLQLIHKA